MMNDDTPSLLFETRRIDGVPSVHNAIVGSRRQDFLFLVDRRQTGTQLQQTKVAPK
jgi:hypothetical protein